MTHGLKMAMQIGDMQQWDPKFGVLSWSLKYIIESAISSSISLGFCLSWSQLSTWDSIGIGTFGKSIFFLPTVLVNLTLIGDAPTTSKHQDIFQI